MTTPLTMKSHKEKTKQEMKEEFAELLPNNTLALEWFEQCLDIVDHLAYDRGREVERERIESAYEKYCNRDIDLDDRHKYLDTPITK